MNCRCQMVKTMSNGAGRTPGDARIEDAAGGDPFAGDALFVSWSANKSYPEGLVVRNGSVVGFYAAMGDRLVFARWYRSVHPITGEVTTCGISNLAM